MPERLALVTGSSSGFGLGLCAGLLERGWSVLATLRGAQKRKGIFAEAQKRFGERLRVLELDVTEKAQREAVRDFVASRSSGLDCLLNNAGYGLFGALEDLSEAQLRDQFEVNFFGAVLLTRDLLPALRRRRGRVINISSVVGYCALPLTSAYCASKFALEGLSEALYHELRPHGVQVALVEPGRFSTRFGDNVRWGEGGGAPASPYARQTANYRRLKERFASGREVPAETVVRAVLRLAEARRMPLRTRVGTDAAAAHLAQRLLPRRAADALFGLAYDRMMLKGDA